MQIREYFKIIPQTFGLDISDSSFKFLQLSEKGGIFNIDVYGEHKLPDGIVTRGVIRDSKKLSAILNDVLSKYKDKSFAKYAVISLPDEETFLKVIHLPQMDLEQAASAVQVEVENYVPVKLEEIYLDFNKITLSKKKEHLDILFAASRKVAVDKYAQTVLDAGFSPVVIEPEVLAISRSIIKDSFSDKPVLILEIGANRTRFIVFLKNSVLLTGSSSFLAQAITQEIAKVLGLDLKESNKLRWDSTSKEEKDNADKIKKAVTPLLEDFAKDISQFLNFLKNMKDQEVDYSALNKIILSGGGARIPFIQEVLSDGLDIPIEMSNPWINLKVENLDKKSILVKEAVRFSTVIGLATRGHAVDFDL